MMNPKFILTKSYIYRVVFFQYDRTQTLGHSLSSAPRGRRRVDPAYVRKKTL